MSNSSLVSHVRISPNKSVGRSHVIDTVTIHCVVGQVTAESLGNIFAPSSKKASSNYGVDKDGRIGMYVEEKDRSWCSSSTSNDNRAITIEVASDASHPYAITSAAYNGLIRLLADICRRNPHLASGLRWQGNKGLIGNTAAQNMTVHRWFANKSCPGDYLYNLHGQIAAEVNAQLGAAPQPTPAPSTGGGYSGASIVDYLNSIGKDSSLSARKNYAAQYGIANYSGTASQNTALLNAMRNSTSAPAPTPQPVPSGYTGTSIVDYLNSVGKDSSFNARKTYAAQYKVWDYTGTAAQNTALLNAMRGGSASATVSVSVETMAQEIIKGWHGDGHATREASLRAKYGNINYQSVRARVNQLM